MKYLFQLNHPAHYHLFKNVMSGLKSKGHKVDILARNKDVLVGLLDGEQYTLLNIPKGQTIIDKLLKIKKTERGILEYVRNTKPDIVVGTGAFGFITKKLNIPTLFFGEDDANLNLPIFIGALLNYGKFSEIVSPSVCYNSYWDSKTIKYEGYQKLAYLHPNNFTPNYNYVNKYIKPNNKFFIVRFAKLNAYHDIGAKGLSYEVSKNLFEILLNHGDIYITSERELEPEYEKYRLNINPKHIHHLLAFADMYIGDSQSMAVEAAMLGTPSIRFNSFVGKISTIEELHQKYHLTIGIKDSNPNRLYETVEKLLHTQELKKEFVKRRDNMLKDKIDVAAFILWFIENYPKSKYEYRKNPSIQFNFK